MPIQQTHTDLHAVPQKLSKIETLRLAKNYIFAMMQTLREDKPMELSRFVKILSQELSQSTANLLSGTLMGGSVSKYFPIDTSVTYNTQSDCMQNLDPLWYFREQNYPAQNAPYKGYLDGNYISNEIGYYNCNPKNWYVSEW